MIMAQASWGSVGFYGRGSMSEGKRTSQGMPSAVCYRQALYIEPLNVLKDKLPFVMPLAAW